MNLWKKTYQKWEMSCVMPARANQFVLRLFISSSICEKTEDSHINALKICHRKTLEEKLTRKGKTPARAKLKRR